MKQIKINLMPNEKITYRAKIHLFIFFQPFIILVFGLYFIFSDIGLNYYLGLTLLFLGLVSFIQRLLIKVGSVFALTNVRLILKTGILQRKSRELILLRTEGFWIEQSVVGRILNFGTLMVTTGGITSTYIYVADPLRFKKEVNICIEERYLKNRLS